MKTGIVFAGQGAQYPGMGKDLYDHAPAARAVFDEAGEQVKSWCFEGTKEMLRMTQVTQPSIYIVTIAAYRALREAIDQHPALGETLEMEGIAGFSLGEYSALTAAGVIRDMAQGLDIVTRRGQLMNEAGMDENGEQRGGMVAAFGPREKICRAAEEAAKGRILSPVNFNSPIQTVVAGEKAALDDFEAVCAQHRLKAKRLSVSTAFHSDLMIPAAKALREILLAADLKAPSIKVYSNVTGRDIMAEWKPEDGTTAGAYLAERMAQQAMQPVYWQEIVENMIADGVEAIIEVGPGHTLSGLIKKVNRKVATMHVEDMASLEATLNKLEALWRAGKEEA
jgi:[acyl-carrier-protein] S-malonyltransferase